MFHSTIRTSLYATLTLLLVTTGAFAGEPSFACHGTEPFWGLKVSADGIVLEMHDEVTRYAYVSPDSAAGFMSDYARIYKLTTATGKKATLVITASDCGCTDGMSDETFTHDVTLITDEYTLMGCGTKE